MSMIENPRGIPVSAHSGRLVGSDSPFDLRNADAYHRWRDKKLRAYPTQVEDLIVEVRDPRSFSAAEIDAIATRIVRANMAIYASQVTEEDRVIPRRVAEQFDLGRQEANWLADDDAISSIQVRDDMTGAPIIPYTDRPIRWHTDGYYNPPQQSIRTMLLHCVRDAKSGGDNELLDHEIAYILLRDRDPDFIRALSADDTMTIPARHDGGVAVRACQTGPVFSIDPVTGRLHMRYTARKHSIAWRDDAITRGAVACIDTLLLGTEPTAGCPILKAHLAPGMGIVCSNVLHTRTAFNNDAAYPRLLYRARYHDPLNLVQTKQGGRTCISTRNWMRADSPVQCPS